MMACAASLVVGCPGSGKSWVCEQLTDRYHYVPHDQFVATSHGAYLGAIIRHSRTATRRLLIETPFSVSKIMEPLHGMGISVLPVFIQEHPEVIRQRYWAREGRDIPPGHLTRQETYRQRAEALGAFQGTSSQVLAHLRKLVP